MNKENQLQEHKDMFIASLGHDLKNPTIAQIRSIELLLKGSFGELKSEQKEILEIVLDSCKYMYGMLSSFLSTYRNDGGQIYLDIEKFSLSNLVNECVSEMLYVAKEKEINIRKHYNDEEFNVNGDLIQIRRVVMNLLSNGIKYASKSTDLQLYLYKKDNNIYFEFKNCSPYIPIDKQKFIFEKYITYSSSVANVGTGLGLYTSKKIIEAHNGRIYLNSNINNTNIFGFSLPTECVKLLNTKIYL